MRRSKFGMVGIAFGSIALMLALAHFWAGPFSPQPTIETAVAEKAASIWSATVDALAGKEPVQESTSTKWDADKITQVSIALLGGLALVLAVISLVQKEPLRVTGGAAVLGISAIAFQFIALYAMALLVVILVAAVLTNFDLG